MIHRVGLFKAFTYGKKILNNIMLKFYALIVLILIFNSCSSDDNISRKIIRIDIEEKRDINLPKISIVSLNPLETNDSTLFGDIASIEFYSNRIYLLDIFKSRSLIEFSNNGNFINRTYFGRGPSELINPFAFCIDKNKKKILIWDQTLNTMFHYDLDLNYLSKHKYSHPIQDFLIVNNNEILVQSHFYKDYVYKLYSNDFDNIIKEYIQDNPHTGANLLFRPISTGKRILLIVPFDYNVYELTGHSLHSEYFFDFGNYKLKQREIEDQDLTWDLINSGQRVSSLYEIAESENFLLFHVYFSQQKIFYAYSLDSDNTIRLNDYFDNESLPVCDIRGIIEKDVFYALVKPTEMIKFQEKTDHKLPEIIVNDVENPIFLTFRIYPEYD